MVSRRDFVKELAQGLGYTQKDVETILNGAGDLICKYGKEHETVKAMDGFVFEGRTVPAREGRNPATGEAMHIQEKTKLVCRFGKKVKDAIQ
jgi:DNA-binding protein HU-beta